MVGKENKIVDQKLKQKIIDCFGYKFIFAKIT